MCIPRRDRRGGMGRSGGWMAKEDGRLKDGVREREGEV